MRLLVHRGQVLLLLAVGVLAGVAVAGVCLQLDGASALSAFHIDELFAAPRSQLPPQIVIGGGAASRTDSGLAGAAAPTAAPAPVQPTPTTAVVPGPVYAYPPDDRGRGGSGGGGGGRDSRGG